jgi:hypothetical protein
VFGIELDNTIAVEVPEQMVCDAGETERTGFGDTEIETEIGVPEQPL